MHKQNQQQKHTKYIVHGPAALSANILHRIGRIHFLVNMLGSTCSSAQRTYLVTIRNPNKITLDSLNTCPLCHMSLSCAGHAAGVSNIIIALYNITCNEHPHGFDSFNLSDLELFYRAVVALLSRQCADAIRGNALQNLVRKPLVAMSIIRSDATLQSHIHQKLFPISILHSHAVCQLHTKHIWQFQLICSHRASAHVWVQARNMFWISQWKTISLRVLPEIVTDSVASVEMWASSRFPRHLHSSKFMRIANALALG